MIKKLRIRFILVALLSILLVLSATIGAINIHNYVQIENEAQNSLSLVIDQGLNNGGPTPGGSPHGPNDNLMQSHYFLVSFDDSGTISNSDFKHIFSINEEDGKNMASDIYNGKANKGSIDNNYRYLKENRGNYTYVAVIDVKEKLDSFNNFLISSIVISSISYALIAALIVISSHVVFKTSEESYQKQKSFITNASHELKTPLTIISTDLEIIEMDHGKDEWSESIRDQVSRLTKMTNQLVTLAKLDEGNLSNYPFTDFSLSSLAEECADAFKATFNKNSLSFNVAIKKDINMTGNNYLINELIYIFLDNALKYAKANGQVDFAITNTKNKVEILFANDLQDDYEIDVKLMFERFYRSPSANKKEGSGVGLSIAKEIINLHKGKINVEVINHKIYFHIYF